MNLGLYYSPSLCWYDLNVNAKLFKKLFILHLQQQNYLKKHLVILLFLHCLGSSPWFISSSTLTLNPFQYLVNLKQIIFHNPDNKNDNIMGKVIVLWIAHLLQGAFFVKLETHLAILCADHSDLWNSPCMPRSAAVFTDCCNQHINLLISVKSDISDFLLVIKFVGIKK